MSSRHPRPPPLSLGGSPLKRENNDPDERIALPTAAVVTPRPKSSDGSIICQTPRARTKDELDAAHLLTSVASLVSQEMTTNQDCMKNKTSNDFLALPNLETPISDADASQEPSDEAPPSPRLTALCSVFDRDQDIYDEEEQEEDDNPRQIHLPSFSTLQHERRGQEAAPTIPSINDVFRIRSVSLDTADAYLPSDIAYMQSSYENVADENRPSTFVAVPTIISPPSSPSVGSRPRNDEAAGGGRSNNSKGSRRLVNRQRKRYLDDLSKDDESDTSSRSNYSNASTILKNHRGTIQPTDKIRPKKKKLRIIRRKKFSWKNFPELEAFLVANREEYLRHSALNYTIQQKKYNNELTQRLIQLASETGYVFDEKSFNFVVVRDRIRCYYKSFVQSRKKKGVVVGYAARRAGLIADDELEKIACSKNKIILPATSGTKSNKKARRK